MAPFGELRWADSAFDHPRGPGALPPGKTMTNAFSPPRDTFNPPCTCTRIDSRARKRKCGLTRARLRSRSSCGVIETVSCRRCTRGLVPRLTCFRQNGQKYQSRESSRTNNLFIVHLRCRPPTTRAFFLLLTDADGVGDVGDVATKWGPFFVFDVATGIPPRLLFHHSSACLLGLGRQEKEYYGY